MTSSTPPSAAAVAVAPRAADEDDIVDAIAAIEVRLAAMQRAMLAGDPTAIETEATGLQRALSACAPLLADPRNAQRVPPSTRTMIANVRARTSAQREALARAGAAADRALAVVIGQSQRALYGADGTATPRPAGDLARA